MPLYFILRGDGLIQPKLQRIDKEKLKHCANVSATIRDTRYELFILYLQ